MRRPAIAILTAILLLSLMHAAHAITVTPFNTEGWQEYVTSDTGAIQFTALHSAQGNGSAELSTGSAGDESAQLRSIAYNGTPLRNLTALRYSTHITQWNDLQAPYIILSIDNDGDGTSDDLLFFEPIYQTGEYEGESIRPQAEVELKKWQTWDALGGGWWSLNNGTFGPPLITLERYIAQHPNASIVNSANGLGGVRIVAGFGSPEDKFVMNVDSVIIGVNRQIHKYDFEPGPPDNDDDSIADIADLCPDTTADQDAGVPAVFLGRTRWIYNGTSWMTNSTQKQQPITMQQTGGCNCAQILEKIGEEQGLMRLGCSRRIIEDWSRNLYIPTTTPE